MAIIRKISSSLKEHNMLNRGERVLLCVSGGPDSVAMLYAFKDMGYGMGLELFIGHLNHMLRGKESDKDQSYVEKLGRHYDIPVFTEKRDVKGFAKKNKLSLEDSARRLRYDFFVKLASSLKIDAVATAHTKDDQAETVLMRFLRGTGLKGLRGIPAKSGLRDFLLIRPMLDISRNEIKAYLKSKGIRPRKDKSNSDIRFFRNKIRLELIPFIEKDYAPSIKQQISTLADLIDKDYQYLSIQQEKAFIEVLSKTAEGIVALRIPGFKRLHPSVKRAAIRRAIEILSDGLEGIDYRHYKEIESLIGERPPGSIVFLPGGIAAEKQKQVIRFRRVSAKSTRQKIPADVLLRIPGSAKFGRKRVRAKFVKRVPDFFKKPKGVEYLDAKKIDFPIMARAWRQGDRIRPLGMKGYKKVSDVFIDEKLPLKKRRNIPLIVSAKGEVLSVCNFRISDTCSITGDTKKILKLEWLTI